MLRRFVSAHPFATRVFVTLVAALVYVGLLRALGQDMHLLYQSQRLMVGLHGYARTLHLAPDPPRPDPNVVLVALDDDTLDDRSIPHWAPDVLRRDAHARLVQELTAGGARVIGFDIVFTGESDHDAELREALEHAPSVVLVSGTRESGGGTRFVEPAPLLASASSVRLASPTIRRHKETGEALGVQLEQNSADGRTYNALAFECYKAFTAEDDARASFSYAAVGAQDVMPIDWPSREADRVFRTVSYREVYTGAWRQKDPELFRGKCVIIGSFSTVAHADKQNTPAGDLFGAMIHALAVQTLLNHTARNDVPVLTWLLSAAAALLATLASYLRRPVLAVIAMLGIAALVVVVAEAGFALHHWIGPWQAMAAIVLFGSAGFAGRLGLSRVMLERYAGHEAARQLVQTGRIQSRTQRATIFFADLRGYTNLSEKLSPAELMEVLNEHYRWMDRIIAKHHGRVDKHIGDAMMAVFEDKRGVKTGHATRALDAAREMVHTAGSRQGAAAELQFGIGIHTGEVTTGALGEAKQEYGSVGDAVNVAARLEQSTRVLDAVVLISEDAVLDAGSDDGLKKLDALALKGKSEPVVVYTLAG